MRQEGVWEQRPWLEAAAAREALLGYRNCHDKLNVAGSEPFGGLTHLQAPAHLLMQHRESTTPEPGARKDLQTNGTAHRRPLPPDTAPGVAASSARESGRRCKGLGGAAHNAASRCVADRPAGERRGGPVRARVLPARACPPPAALPCGPSAPPWHLHAWNARRVPRVGWHCPPGRRAVKAPSVSLGTRCSLHRLQHAPNPGGPCSAVC